MEFPEGRELSQIHFNHPVTVRFGHYFRQTIKLQTFNLYPVGYFAAY